MLKKIYIFFIFILFSFVLMACGKTEKEGVAYGFTYKDYIAVATVKVENEVVTSVVFDEYFLPSTWAKVKVLDTEVPSDVIVSGNSWYGKYIVIGDKNFTGDLREQPLVIDNVTYSNQSVKYSSNGIDDLFVWLRSSEENMLWYAQAVEENKVFVAKADYTTSTYETAGLVDSNNKLAFKKSLTNYWNNWAPNMEEIAKAITGTKMGVADADIKQQDGKWVIGDIQSGATNVSFKEYYAVAQKAYNKAK
jgi:hypothetical protein